ncbi:hypothetical protein [Paenibacillus ferrarius]|uniref:hypothetical protein n=1 Tax=Paenibacillus ferrarius TaxID=1469647 RepID=UPI003D2B8725
MWNLYDIEKKYEQHVKELEERARKAHWYAKVPQKRAKVSLLAGGVALIAVLAAGYFAVSNALS